MSRFMIAIAAVVALLGGFTRAEAGIVVTVDKSAQRLSVTVDGFPRYEWPGHQGILSGTDRGGAAQELP